jgi:hypothetical protein
VTRSGRRGAALAALAVLGLPACKRPAAPPAPAPAAPQAAAPAAPSPPAPAELEPPEPLAPRDPADTVTIKLLADARREAHVFWGRKDLGAAPLDLKRPRGSGPVDLLVVAPGSLPLHTRVFTDRDESLSLRLYSAKEATALVGWKPADAESEAQAKTDAKTEVKTDAKTDVKTGPNRVLKTRTATAPPRHRF